MPKNGNNGHDAGQEHNPETCEVCGQPFVVRGDGSAIRELLGGGAIILTKPRQAPETDWKNMPPEKFADALNAIAAEQLAEGMRHQRLLTDDELEDEGD